MVRFVVVFGRNPMGYLIPPSAKVNTKPAPSMAAFSSRGPNFISPEIIKVNKFYISFQNIKYVLLTIQISTHFTIELNKPQLKVC